MGWPGVVGPKISGGAPGCSSRSVPSVRTPAVADIRNSGLSSRAERNGDKTRRIPRSRKSIGIPTEELQEPGYSGHVGMKEYGSADAGLVSRMTTAGHLAWPHHQQHRRGLNCAKSVAGACSSSSQQI
ncbi:hypothetical protein SKAU_G00420280 [Synaphobranchus kaupii]|uniref:Uncharacterized protein n=1 Tax=Synaphobranchus kaupii TaxID=118154 RepID=A0A9Q1E6J0_SYNKA|nr:hypothetical protein SKAU_G00420280 [Synaphobranchus kaupii]